MTAFAAGEPMTAVLVQRVPWGETAYQLCHADVFDHDRLTITVTETGRVADVFEPGTWREATMFDERSYPIAHFESTVARQQDAARKRIA